MQDRIRQKARVIKNVNRVKEVPVLVPVCEDDARETGLPSVRLVREDERGAWIEVLCSCGRSVMVECLYGAAKEYGICEDDGNHEKEAD